MPFIDIMSFSPERFLSYDNNIVETKPIKGTRPVSQNPEDNMRALTELSSSYKEKAENLMIVDLLRNDLSRVCRLGSVEVSELARLESFANVHHLVSEIRGTLFPTLGPIDLLRATFPGGSITGAPKVRAMEIIHELEPSSRGIYGGAIGYISWNGNIDTAIAIRTAVIKDNIIHVGAGAGIVADSVPENEWLECKQKSKAFIDAMEMIS